MKKQTLFIIAALFMTAACSTDRCKCYLRDGGTEIIEPETTCGNHIFDYKDPNDRHRSKYRSCEEYFGK